MAADGQLLRPVGGAIQVQTVAFPRNRAIMTEKRIASRRRLLKTGAIILSDKAPKIQCALKNASEKGAALQVSTTIGIPANFDVIVDGMRRRCRSQWRTDTKIGTRFD